MLEDTRSIVAPRTHQCHVGTQMIHVPARSDQWPEVMPEASAESAGAKAAADIEEPASRECNRTQCTDRWTNRSTTTKDEDVATGLLESMTYTGDIEMTHGGEEGDCDECSLPEP